MNRINFDSEPLVDSSSRLKAPEWDLSDLYKGFDDKQIENDFARVIKMVGEFVSKYQGKVSSLKEDEILQAVKKYEEIGELTSKIATFSYLHRQYIINVMKIF